ncbi:MAG: peptide-methionine (S)-S-oxide reductase MsrA [Planctomycetota bacterium]
MLTVACCGGGESRPIADRPPNATTIPHEEPRPDAPSPTTEPMTESDDPTPNVPPATGAAAAAQTITLGAGCFWCIEAVLERVDGVLDVESGYMGGTVDQPTYKQVCTGDTGHAEVVRVRYDPARLPLSDLLDWFFKAHDPTTLNRQGNDYGTQYRSAIFFESDAQRAVAEAAMERAQEEHGGRVVTEITRASAFWPAEDYHQDFFANNPTQGYCRAIIPPKLKKLGLDGDAAKAKSTEK